MGREVDKSVISAATTKAKSLPASTQFALATALPNIVNGAFWGFSNVKECQKFSEELKNDANLSLKRLSGDDVIVEVNPNYICNAMATIDASVVTPADIQKMNEGIQKACAVFEKFLSQKTKTGYSGYIGIYCINDVASIVLKGKSYPAFRLPLNQIIAYLAKYGWKINTSIGQIPANAIGNNASAVWSSIIMSPTHTGVFLPVSSR